MNAIWFCCVIFGLLSALQFYLIIFFKRKIDIQCVSSVGLLLSTLYYALSEVFPGLPVLSWCLLLNCFPEQTSITTDPWMHRGDFMQRSFHLWFIGDLLGQTFFSPLNEAKSYLLCPDPWSCWQPAWPAPVCRVLQCTLSGILGIWCWARDAASPGFRKHFYLAYDLLCVLIL